MEDYEKLAKKAIRILYIEYKDVYMLDMVCTNPKEYEEYEDYIYKYKLKNKTPYLMFKLESEPKIPDGKILTKIRL